MNFGSRCWYPAELQRMNLWIVNKIALRPPICQPCASAVIYSDNCLCLQITSTQCDSLSSSGRYYEQHQERGWKSRSSNKKEYKELIQCIDVTNRTSSTLRSSIFKDGTMAGEMRVEMLLHSESSTFPVFNTHRRC